MAGITPITKTRRGRQDKELSEKNGTHSIKNHIINWVETGGKRKRQVIPAFFNPNYLGLPPESSTEGPADNDQDGDAAGSDADSKAETTAAALCNFNTVSHSITSFLLKRFRLVVLPASARHNMIYLGIRLPFLTPNGFEPFILHPSNHCPILVI